MFLQPHRTTTTFQGFAAEFSPYDKELLAISTSQHFGIVGNGRLHILRLSYSGFQNVRCFDTQHGLHDCAWSESDPQYIVSASANGKVYLWHMQSQDSFPIMIYSKHAKDVVSVQWNLVAKDCFASASWDKTVNIWRPEFPTAVQTLSEHTASVYDLAWSAKHRALLASSGSDRAIKVWDLHAPHSVLNIPQAHLSEVLTLDWNKYNEFQLISGGTDRVINVWDTRRLAKPLRTLEGHTLGVRRLKCSPHKANIIGSVSYDMTARIWDISRQAPKLQTVSKYREFVFGIDFNLFTEGFLATCAWDCSVVAWNFRCGPP